MKRANRGFNLIEALIAMALVVTAFLVVLSVFAAGVRFSTSARSRMHASLILHSLIEEMHAHPYGSPAPKRWTSDVDVTTWIQGLPSHTIFHQEVTAEDGSFVGRKSGFRDQLTITVTWREGTGPASSGLVKREMTKIPVWRENDTTSVF